MQKVTNDSGNGYCKMPDGTLICWGVDNSWSSNSKAFTFPVTFYTEHPAVTISTGAGSVRIPIYIEDVTSSGFNAVRLDDATRSVWVRYIAIGRWKA